MNFFVLRMNKPFRTAAIFFFLCFLCAPFLTGLDTISLQQDYSKGPLYGKNLFIPFLIHYNFPSFSAKTGTPYHFTYHASLYYVQDAHYVWSEAKPRNYLDERHYDTKDVLRDYESFVGELGASYAFYDAVQGGIDIRILSYYGGFLDSLIEGFHDIFKFPGGMREYFEKNRLYVNIPNVNGINLFLNRPTVSFGDIDIWGKWTIFQNAKFSFAFFGAYKMPSGTLGGLSGSGFPDVGVGTLYDIRASHLFTFYVNAGIVLPYNVKSKPMFNGLLGVEIHPLSFLSFIAQMNIKTSPLIDDKIDWSWNEIYGTNFKAYAMPQTNVLIGVIAAFKNFKFQFYFEEDAITNQGADLTVNFMFSHSIYFKPAILFQ
jgi:hypothetical protein